MAVSSVSNQANAYGSMYTSQKQDKDVGVSNEKSANQDTVDVGKYLEELKKKNPKLNINSGVSNMNMRSGNYPNQVNVSIAPNILQQMATDPEAASKYGRMLSNIPKLEQWARGMTRALTGGNEVLYSHVWIDENGGMGRFSVSGPSKAQKMADAKRHEDAKKAFEERLEKARKKRKELEEWIAGQREKMPVADEDWMDIRKIDVDAIEAGNKWQIPAVEDLNENGNMRTFEAGNEPAVKVSISEEGYQNYRNSIAETQSYDEVVKQKKALDD